jgi:hypothetical protein
MGRAPSVEAEKKARCWARNARAGPQAAMGRIVGRGPKSTVKFFIFFFIFFQKHLNNCSAQLLNSI